MTRKHGQGGIFKRKRTKRSTGEVVESRFWTLQWYDRHGVQKREPTKLTDERAAEALLRKRIRDVEDGRATGPAVNKTTLADLRRFIEDDYRNNDRKTLDDLGPRIDHLEEFFGEKRRAVEIDTPEIEAYKSARRDEGAKNATINRELAALKRMLRLAHRYGRLAQVPHIALLEERNARKGFFEEPEFLAVQGKLPGELRPLARVLYETGWRASSEVLTRQWRHVDLEGGWLRLEPEETKSRKGRNFPFTAGLREALETQRAYTTAVEAATGKIVPWVFHRDGEPVRYFRRAWITACVNAGLGEEIRDPTTEKRDDKGNVVKLGRVIKRTAHRIPHDFRRTAVRNLERAGVPRSTAMALVGHETESIYRRYAIVDEGMLLEGVAKLDALHAAAGRRAGARKVLRHRPRKP